MNLRKRTLFAYLFMVLIWTNSSYAQQVQVKANRLHGLLVFAFSNAGFLHYSPYIKEYTTNSKYKDQVGSALSDISNLEKSLRQSVSFRVEGKGYGDGFSVQNLAETQSAYAKDIDDLMTRLQGTMPIEDWIKFGKILKPLDPIYEDLIWSQTKNDIESTEKIYSQKMKEWNVEALFKKAKIFYKSQWPEDLKFQIALYPIPKGAHHSNAHSIGTFESVGIIVGEKDIAGRFGVIFHEMMHSLYNMQDTKFKEELLSWYQLDKNNVDYPFRSGAQRFSNEIFATLLGNGWAYEMAAGQPDKASWYSEDHIEGMARGNYELIKQYLKEEKPIDAKFVLAMITKFKELFPDYPESGDYLFSNLEIQHTGKYFKSPEIRKAIRSNFRSSDLSILGDSDLLSKFKPSHEALTMVLLSNDEAKHLTLKQIKTLNLPKKLIQAAKLGNAGMWKWKDKNGLVRILSIGSPNDLNNLFVKPITSI